MWRWAKLILAIMLCAAAIVPPRLHAALPGHDHAAKSHSAMSHSAMAAALHDHADDACSHAPALPVASPDLALSICIAACACLPAVALAAPVAHPFTPGEKLAMTNTAMPALPQPDGLFRPPRHAS